MARVQPVGRCGHIRGEVRARRDVLVRVAKERSPIIVAGLAESVADGPGKHPGLDHGADREQQHDDRAEESEWRPVEPDGSSLAHGATVPYSPARSRPVGTN